jgi:lipid-A-disaccharide synthase
MTGETHPTNPCVMIIAGEASGDLHGAALIAAMKKIDRSIFFCGIGGGRMKSQGLAALADSSEMAVMGITEIFSRIFTIFKISKAVKAALLEWRPDLLILIDYPGFNLPMAEFAKKNGIPVLYYISPKVWAWRRGRVKKIEKYVDHLALIFPFEVDFYKNYHITTTFVGNPLLDYSPEPPPDKSIERERLLCVGLLPGSREAEISRLFPVMLKSAPALVERLGKRVRFLISVAPSVDREKMRRIFNQEDPQGEFEFVEGDVRQVFDRVRFVIAASGTVTLEAAIALIPMVIIYKMSPVTFFLGRLFIKLNHVGLASIIAGEEAAPELLQEEANPLAIAETACRFLSDDALYAATLEKLKTIRERLGGPGASERTARIALEMITRKGCRVEQ